MHLIFIFVWGFFSGTTSHARGCGFGGSESRRERRSRRRVSAFLFDENGGVGCPGPLFLRLQRRDPPPSAPRDREFRSFTFARRRSDCLQGGHWIRESAPRQRRCLHSRMQKGLGFCGFYSLDLQESLSSFRPASSPETWTTWLDGLLKF